MYKNIKQNIHSRIYNEIIVGLNDLILNYISPSSVFCPKAGPSLQAEKPRLQFCRRQVFQRKLRNQGWSFTRNLIFAVASRCYPHLTLSLASEQTLKDLKRYQGHQRGDEESGFVKFTTGVKHKFQSEFLTRSEIRKSQSTFAPYCGYIKAYFQNSVV